VERDDIDDGRLIYIFLTAWSPPSGIVKHLAQHYPELSFDLETIDSDMGWRYTLTARGGQFEEASADYVGK
jgi:hypothetical protein